MNNITFGTGSFYIGEEPIGTGTLIEDIDTIPDTYEPHSLLNPMDFECELDSCIDISTLNMLTDNDPLGGLKKFALEYDSTYLEQVRRHKKKRINKKWAKRYGYREVPCKYRFNNARLSEKDGVTIEVQTDDFEIIKEKRR